MKSYILFRSIGLALLMICSAFGPGFQEIPTLSFFNLVLILTLIHTTMYNKVDYPCLFVVFTIGEWRAYAQAFGTDPASLLQTLILSMAFVLLVGIFCAIPLRCLPKRYQFFALHTRQMGNGAPFIFPICFIGVVK